MPLDVSTPVPNFTGRTQTGEEFDFKKRCEGKWTLLFSYPRDFTPVCTTELSSFARHASDFAARNCQLVSLSPDSVASHAKFLKEIETLYKTPVTFPVLADEDSSLLDLLKMRTASATMRTVYIVDPALTVQFVQVHPVNAGRDIDYLLQVLDSIQLASMREAIATPADWRTAKDEVVVLPGASLGSSGHVTKRLRPYLTFGRLSSNNADVEGPTPRA